MDNQLGGDQDRKCDEESGMHFNVVKEGKPTDAPSRGTEGAEEQQRQPCDQRDNEQPAMQEFQAISGEMRPPKELEDRATQYQGKIGRFLAGIGFRHRRLARISSGDAIRRTFCSEGPQMSFRSQTSVRIRVNSDSDLDLSRL
jgi:hypothetical protein